jgi:hypothetical protein
VINKDKNGQSNLMHDDTFGPYHDTLGFTATKISVESYGST